MCYFRKGTKKSVQYNYVITPERTTSYNMKNDYTKL